MKKFASMETLDDLQSIIFGHDLKGKGKVTQSYIMFIYIHDSLIKFIKLIFNSALVHLILTFLIVILIHSIFSDK